MKTVLAIKDLGVAFDTDRGTLNAVRGVTLDLESGECLGVVGESGSGKTVLWRTAMGLLRGRKVLRTGSVKLGDVELLTMSGKEIRSYWGTKIAMVFQDPMTTLNPVRRIGSQFSEALVKRLGLSKEGAAAQTIEMLRKVRLAEPEKLVRKYPLQLSGGMRQRVMIAMAIACKPEILLADEPTTALDVTVQAQVLELISDLRNEFGMSMVIVTHDLGIVAGYCDRIAVMYAGEIVELANTVDLFANPRMPYTEALLNSIPKLTDSSGAQMRSIEGAPPDPVSVTKGCFFAPRCSYATDRCRNEHPDLVDAGNGRMYRCFFPVGIGK
jgi:oligopeptide/dipeptide ABC transporter ATP-binding protein